MVWAKETWPLDAISNTWWDPCSDLNSRQKVDKRFSASLPGSNPPSKSQGSLQSNHFSMSVGLRYGKVTADPFSSKWCIEEGTFLGIQVVWTVKWIFLNPCNRNHSIVKKQFDQFLGSVIKSLTETIQDQIRPKSIENTLCCLATLSKQKLFQRKRFPTSTPSFREKPNLCTARLYCRAAFFLFDPRTRVVDKLTWISGCNWSSSRKASVCSAKEFAGALALQTRWGVCFGWMHDTRTGNIHVGYSVL